MIRPAMQGAGDSSLNAVLSKTLGNSLPLANNHSHVYIEI